MPRYIAQRDGYSCAPIALINALKWLGYRMTYADLPSFQDACVTMPGYGTDGADFQRAVSAMAEITGIKVTRRLQPELYEVDAALAEGQAVLLRSRFETSKGIEGHLCLLTERTERSFFVVNVGQRHRWMRKRYFADRYFQTFEAAPAVWYLRPT